MTQAPTPGPLSVGDRVVAIADLRQTPNGSVWIKKGEEAVIVGELGVNNCLAIVLASNGNEGTWAKTCFRLAPTAPVEASGSELADAIERVDRWANYEYTYEDTVAVGSPLSTFTAGDLRLILAALRPQPSGDQVTDWARALYGSNTFYEVRDDWHDMAPNDGGTHDLHMDMARAAKHVWDHADSPQPSGETREQMIAAMREHIELGEIGTCSAEIVGHEEAADAILALLSASPLASGGQHSGGETIEQRFPALNDHLIRMASSGSTGTLTEWGEFFNCLRDALSTTPARAEAQDEGAAGYKAALIDDLRRYYNDCTPPQMHYAQSDGLAFALDTAIRLLSEAHPSPTPAADADRGMKAFNFINDLYRIKAEFPAIRLHGALKKAEALAALKSEGK